jgi:hypothetical protein
MAAAKTWRFAGVAAFTVGDRITKVYINKA